MIKRIINCIIAIIISLFSVCIISCRNQTAKGEGILEDSILSSKLSVTFLDVGHGDCTFIRLPDGKNMLIDCGNNTEESKQIIIDYLTAFSVTKIDYLILTAPLNCHIGNAEAIINSFEIGVAYTPYIKNLSPVPLFAEVKNLLENKKIEVKNPYLFNTIKGEDYAFMFLSPAGKGFSEVNGVGRCSYDEFNLSLAPTVQMMRNLSPIIFFQYKDYKMVFSSSADSSQEDIIYKVNQVDMYNVIDMPTGAIDFAGVDVYKVSAHGSSAGNSAQFLNMLKPKSAVISVGGDNTEYLPESSVIERLLTSNEECEIYRTDYYGNITVAEINNKLSYFTKI